MTVPMDSGTKPETIYVELLDEGIDCIRPTLGVPLGGGRYRLLPTAQYDPEDEHWQFVPGSVVRCRRETWSEGEHLVARQLAD